MGNSIHTIRDLIDKNAILYKDKVFLTDGYSHITYSGLLQILTNISNGLAENKVKRQERVTVFSKNSIDVVLMILGAMYHGSIAMPIGNNLMQEEINNLVGHADPSILVSDQPLKSDNPLPVKTVSDFLQTNSFSQEARELIDEQDGAVLLYTSGTTGLPKGILLSHVNLLTGVDSIVKSQNLDSRHVRMCFLPVYHSFGLISDVMTMLYSGGECVIMEEFSLYAVTKIQEFIFRKSVNSFSTVPLVFEIMNECQIVIDSSELKFCISGGAKLKKHVAERFMAINKFPILQGYGLSETSCYSTVNPLEKNDIESVGKPIACNQVRILGADDQVLPPNETGEVVIIGSNVMKNGYYKNSAIEAYVNDDNSTFKTGDLGYLNEEGYLYIVGRKKNMVIRGGDKIYLEDVDYALSKFNEIKDSASMKTDHDDKEFIFCFVCPKNDKLSERQVFDQLRTVLGAARLPDRVIFLNEIPRTHTKKVKYKMLAEQAQLELNKEEQLLK